MFDLLVPFGCTEGAEQFRKGGLDHFIFPTVLRTIHVIFDENFTLLAKFTKAGGFLYFMAW